jgi:hypothetical protein
MSSNADDLPANSNLNNTTNKCLDSEADVKEMARAIIFGQENQRLLVADAKPAPNFKHLPADDDDDEFNRLIAVLVADAPAPNIKPLPANDDDDEFNRLIDSTIHDPHPRPRPYDVRPSTVVLLRSFSVNNTLGDNEQALLEIINAHVTNGKMRELLTIYEKALDIEPIMPRLGNNWKKGNRKMNNITRWHAWKMHKSLEANISDHLGERFEFISILHFALFMLANNGYVRKHRVGSCANQTKWGKINTKPIGRSYSTIAKILNKTLA